MSPSAGETARCFVGLWLPRPAREALEVVVRRLRANTTGVRWVPPSRWHVTLAFLGDVPRARLTEVRAVLRALEVPLPLRLGISGLGAFPDPARPRVVWAGLDGDVEALGLLAGRVTRALEEVGFPREERPFRAHVTLGRVKHARAAPALRAELSAQGAAAPPAVVSTFSLVESTLTPDGPDYEELDRFGGPSENHGRESDPDPSQA